MRSIMVEKTKEAIQASVQVPVWVFLIMIPILISLLQVTVNQTNAQTKLQTEMEMNKARAANVELSVENLRITKADVSTIARFEKTLDRMEQKLDEYIVVKK